MKSLMRLESWIEQLVEAPFVRLFAGRLFAQDVARHLARALEDGERIGADGTPEVPGRYRIALNPEDLEALQTYHPDLDTQLAIDLQAVAESMQVRLMEPPAILLEARADLPMRAVRITPAIHTPFTQNPTRDLDLEAIRQRIEQEEAGTLGANGSRAYLIIQGTHTFDLSKPVVRIGRALDNDLILEDPRVSRYHAQLSCRYRRYILQDTGSRGGTTVNGFPVQEIVLRPGDVISFSGVDLIYAEEIDDWRKDNTNVPVVEDSPTSSDTQTYPVARS
jgi:pSer/pThr/pTyr-binding forkhead associated (FHA) protein